MRCIVFLVLGCFFFVLGTVGIVLSLLPTVPLYLLTVFFFSQSSPSLRVWLCPTQFYKSKIAPIAADEGMSVQDKIAAFGALTLLLGISFASMSRIVWDHVILAGVWLFHLWLFWVKIPTKVQDATEGEEL
jgi:uncharacterized membrane protein YbaN (DUF454 family)